MPDNLVDSVPSDVIVPIARFYSGETDKIFNEVNEVGSKLVVKDKSPVCVLLSMDAFWYIASLFEAGYVYMVI